MKTSLITRIASVMLAILFMAPDLFALTQVIVNKPYYRQAFHDFSVSKETKSRERGKIDQGKSSSATKKAEDFPTSVIKSDPSAAVPVNSFDFEVFSDAHTIVSSQIQEKATIRIPEHIKNVTRSAFAYQFNGVPDQPYHIAIGINPQHIQTPSQLSEVRVFFLDLLEKKWKEASMLNSDFEKLRVEAMVPGGSDYFAGLITSPEMPEANTFVPTAISDLEPANPSAGMRIMEPPQVNKTGSANLNYPLWIPQGRNGMTPQLSVSYSSDGGAGWLGNGWSIANSSISVDPKWGVPIYSENSETEGYVYDGDALYQEGGFRPNKPELDGDGKVIPKKRIKSVSRFFPRIQNSWQKIERKGSGPNSYVWIVTDASNTIRYYGTQDGERVEESSVLREGKDGPIAQWFLTKIQDQWGNNILYTYTPYSNSSSRDIKSGGKNLYLSQITYTGYNSTAGRYSVVFNSSGKRTDGRVNMNYGFKVLDDRILDNIKVYYDTDLLVEYEFTYNNSRDTHFQTVLTGITEKRGGTEFYSHTMEYYSSGLEFEETPVVLDVGKGVGYLEEAPWYVRTILSPLYNNITPSPLNTSLSDGSSGHGSIGIGLDEKILGVTISKDKAINIGINGSKSNTRVQRQMQDMNADGLPDILEDQGDKVYYRPLKRDANGILSIGVSREVGINDFNLSTNKSIGAKVEIVGPKASGPVQVGVNFSRDKSHNLRRLIDYNADGFPDLLTTSGSGDKILFGELDSQEKYIFKGSSESTYNPVIKGEGASIPSDDGDLKPMELVKSWTAFEEGQINISGLASLAYNPEGVVEVAIQHNGSFLAGGFQKVTKTSSQNFNINQTVSKGDIIMFRVRCEEDGQEDLLQWDPRVRYTSVSRRDGQDVDWGNSSASEAFTFSSTNGVSFSGDRNFRVDNIFNNSTQFSDDVNLFIDVYINGEHTDTYGEVLSKNTSGNPGNTFAPFIKGNPSLATYYHVLGSDEEDIVSLKFRAVSSSNIDWNAFSWLPVVEMEADCKDPVENLYPIPELMIYNKLDLYGAHNSLTGLEPGQSYQLLPDIAEDPEAISSIILSEEVPSGLVYMTLKSEGRLYQKIGIELDINGNLQLKNIDVNSGWGPFENTFKGSTTLSKNSFTSATDAYFTADGESAEIKVEFFAKGPYAKDMIGYIQLHLHGFNLYDPGNHVGNFSNEHVSYFYRHYNEISMEYKHWGVFGWSPLDGEENLPISPVDLHFPLDGPGAPDPNNLDTNFVKNNPDQFNANDFEFWTFQAIRGENSARDLWIYQQEEITAVRDMDHYGLPGLNNGHFRLAGACTPILAGEVDLSRVTLGDMPTGTFDPNYTATGVTSKSKSYTLAINAGVGQVSASTNISDPLVFYSRSLNMFQDLNGDGYADILYEDDGIKGHFTTPTGGHKGSSGVSNISVLGKGTSIGGAASWAGAYTNEDEDFRLSGGISGNMTYSKTRSSLIDINGDGLPDSYEDSDGSETFHLNTGYGFESNSFAAKGFIRNQSFSIGLSGSVWSAFSGSFSKWVKSISAGFNINQPGNYTEKLYFDFNGDGLSDYIDLYQSDKLYINTGTSFIQYSIGSSITPDNANINKSTTTGFSAQASLTLGPIITFIKLPVSGGYSDNFSVTRLKNSFMDMNGDGAPDYVHADGDQLKIYYAKFGKAQKLKKVTNPLGGSFVIDYKVEGNKRGYHAPQVKTHLSDQQNEKILWDMPNSKWVMSSVTMYDGVDVKNGNDDLDGADSYTTTYAYDGGIRLRREREFSGFTRIATIQPDHMGVLEDYCESNEEYVEVEEPRSTDGWYSCPLHTNGVDRTSIVNRKRYNMNVKDYQKPEGTSPREMRTFTYHAGLLTNELQLHVHEWTDEVEVYEAINSYCNEGSYFRTDQWTHSHVELISDHLSEYEMRLVETGVPGTKGTGLGEVIKAGDDWQLLDKVFEEKALPEVLTVFPAVTDKLEINYPVVENRDGVNIQKYRIDYDKLFNVTWFEDFGELLEANIKYEEVGEKYIGRWDSIIQTNACNNLSNNPNTDLYYQDIDAYTYRVVAACDSDATYSDDIIYGVYPYSSACGDYPGMGPRTVCNEDEGNTFQSIHSKWVLDTMKLYKAIDASKYDHRIIATMDYFDPSVANNRTNALEVHKVWSQNTSSPANNLRSFTKVESLYQDKAVAQIGNYLSHDPAGPKALTDISYNGYGNVTSITAPENINSQRATTSFTYDSDVHQFVTRVDNAYSEFVCNIYDVKYQHLLQTTGINGHKMRYTYDNFQRLEHIWAPREFNDPTNGPTISYSYTPGVATPVAFTYHNTSSLGLSVSNGTTSSSCDALSDISGWATTMATRVGTATFTDGMNRVVQIQMETDWDDPSTTTDHTMALKTRASGIAEYDIFGNVISQGNDFLVGSSSFGTLQKQSTDAISKTIYDYLKRPVEEQKAYSGTGSAVGYGTYTTKRDWEDLNGSLRYYEEVKSASQSATQTFLDHKGRKVRINKGAPSGLYTETTDFTYDELSQLKTVTDPAAQITSYAYDFLGRTTEEVHPDRGTIETVYDKAGNVTELHTPGTEQEISNGYISLDYNFNRITEKNMPSGSSYEDMYNVSYTYGSRGDGKNGAGRITSVVQGKPANPVLVEHLKYDELGNVSEQSRTLDIPQAGTKTYTSGFRYDSFGRALRVSYPEQEDLNYLYSAKGALTAIDVTTNCPNVPNLIDEISYDGYGNIIYMKYGNDAENNFEYHTVTRGLLSSKVSARLPGGTAQQQVMGRQYTYNNLEMVSESDIKPHKSFIGTFVNLTLATTYTYNDLLQLAQAETKVGSNTIYNVTTTFDPAGRINYKGSTPTSGYSYVDPALDYQSTITYSTAKPHQMEQIAQVVSGGTATLDYSYNLSGSVSNISRNLNGDTTGSSRMLWNEEQWLVADRVDADVHHYVYDHKGERIMKTSYTYTTVWQNDNAISSTGVLDAYTVYVNPYIVKSYHDDNGTIEEETTYHYYMNTQRVASGRFNKYSGALPDATAEVSTATAGGSSPGLVATDQLVKVLETFGYKEGEDFERSDLEKPIPMEVLYPEFAGTDMPTPEGEPEGEGDPYGEDCEYGARIEVYWYHPNYLGNVDLITNKRGEVHQFFLYTTWGESLHQYNAQTTGFDSPYRFNGKELDEETGNYYYGARYYDPKVSVWLSVDPLASSFPHQSPYAFTDNNPVNLVDPTGMSAESPWIYDQQADGSYQRREGVENDGGENFHTYNNNDGTTSYYNQSEGTFVTVDNSETTQKVNEVRSEPETRLGSLGIGVNFEVMYPGSMTDDGEPAGYGLSLDLMADADNNLSLFKTTKTADNSMKNQFGLSIDLQFSFTTGTGDNPNPLNGDLTGPGFEWGAGSGPMGYSQSTNLNRSYKMHTVPIVPRGIDFGTTRWKTNTSEFKLF